MEQCSGRFIIKSYMKEATRGIVDLLSDINYACVSDKVLYQLLLKHKLKFGNAYFEIFLFLNAKFF